MRWLAQRLLTLVLLLHVGITTILHVHTLGTEQPCDEERVPDQRTKALAQTRPLTTAENCAAVCRKHERCNAWFWCKEDGRACWDRQSRREVAPRRCLLLATTLAPGPPPDSQSVEEAPFTSFAAGFYVDRAHRYLRYDAPPRLIIASTVRRCEGLGARVANRLNWVSIVNKLDYAHLHGFEFWLHVEQGDADKVDVLRRMLAEAPQGAWLLWADFDTVFANRAFSFPFAQYEAEGRHLVLGGTLSEVLNGNGYKADTGVLLLRNTAWTRALYSDVRTMIDDRTTVRKMVTGLAHYHEEYGGRNDRTALVWLVYNNPDKYMPQVHFESRYCIACFWAGQKPETSFITHFLKTEKCNQFSLARNSTYNPLLLNHYRMSRCTFMQGAQSQAQPLEVLAAAHRSAAPGFSALHTPYAYQAALSWPQVLRSGRRHRVQTPSDCRAACRRTVACNAWLHCWHPTGCDGGRGGRRRRRVIPHNGCVLLNLPADEPFDLLARGPLYSSFSIGFFTASARASQHMRRRRQVPDADRDSAASDQLQRSSRGRAAGQGASSQHVRPHTQQQRQRQEQFHEQQLQWLEQLNEQQPQPRMQHAEDQSSAASSQPERWQQVRRRLSCWRWGPWQHLRRRLQQDRPRQRGGTAAQHSTAADGADSATIKVDGMHRNVAMLTAIPPTPCKAPLADLINSLSLANKVDYARMHGYELHFSASNIEANATGVFNKESMIMKMLQEASPEEAAWLWWLDIDTAMVNLTRPLPLQDYIGRDLIGWGNYERLKAGDVMQGINNGILLIRNSDWSRKFWGEVTAHATTEGLAEWRPELEAELGPLPTGFFDTPIIVYLLKTRPEYYERVYFELGPVGFNRHWLSVNWHEAEEPLVVHYAGCTTCSPPTDVISEATVTECNNAFALAFTLSKCLQQRHFLQDGRRCEYNGTSVAHVYAF